MWKFPEQALTNEAWTIITYILNVIELLLRATLENTPDQTESRKRMTEMIGTGMIREGTAVMGLPRERGFSTWLSASADALSQYLSPLKGWALHKTE